jgi:DNA/RNA-binding domain of Phe-tRNA-synthetase-like protein
MLQLIVHQDAQQLGITNPVACLVRKVRISAELGFALDDDVRTTVDNLPGLLADAAVKPPIQGFETLFQKLGYIGQVPAGRRLMELVGERGFRRHNNVVDACNIASIEFGAGLGLHDATDLTEDIHVYRATGEERIRPLFKETECSIRAGDLVYGSTGRIIAWLGEKDVDSDDLKISETTQYLLVMALGNEHTTMHYNRSACARAVSLMRKTCPEVYAQFIPTILQPLRVAV